MPAAVAKPEPKFLVSYCLVPEGTKRLQAFMDKRFGELQEGSTGAMDALRNEMWDVLPAEARADLRKVLMNRADFVVQIHGFPEVKGLENKPDPDTSGRDAYSPYFGRALYELFGVVTATPPPRLKPVVAVMRDRKRQHENGEAPVTHAPHRDLMGDYIIFSTAYNGEHSLTEFIRMKDVLKALTKKELRELQFIITDTRTKKDDPPQCRNGEEIRAMLTHDVPNLSRVLAMRLASSRHETAAQRFLAELAKPEHSQKLDIQPGTLVAICENNVFHCGHPADPAKLAEVPDTVVNSRILYHHAGKRATPSVSDD